MQSFNEIIGSEMPVLVDFHAVWCGPCKAMSPIISDVAKTMEGRAKVIKVDIDKSPYAAQTYSVQAVPTFILFKKGEIVWRHSGMIDKKSLLEAISRNS